MPQGIIVIEKDEILYANRYAFDLLSINRFLTIHSPDNKDIDFTKECYAVLRNNLASASEFCTKMIHITENFRQREKRANNSC